MRKEREDLKIPYANGDCTSFVLYNLVIQVEDGRVNGEVLDDFLARLQTTTEQHEPTLIVYSKRPFSRHFGFLKEGKVISKWGLGQIYEHDIDDVNPAWKTNGCVQYSLPEDVRDHINRLFPNQAQL